MLGNDSNPKSGLARSTYHSIEEVNEVVQTAGWAGEFRQLGRGRVTSRWRSQHLGRSTLTSHHINNRIHVCQTPPRGCVALGIVLPPYSLLVDGVEVGNHEAFLLHADSRADIVVPGESACETLAVPQSVFESSARALFPRMQMNGPPVRVFQCAPSGWSALRRNRSGLLRDGQMSLEDVSNLLTRFLELMAGDPENSPREQALGKGSARRVARRAQEYIEEHYRDTILMEDICRYTGVSLRTLQRSFSFYFQVSPCNYIKARRLNAARQALVAADSSRGQVARIAVANGCTHLGRFSVNYREHFGESPRETLAQSWNGHGKGSLAEAFCDGFDTTK